MEPNPGEGILEYIERALPFLLDQGASDSDAVIACCVAYRCWSFTDDANQLEAESVRQCIHGGMTPSESAMRGRAAREQFMRNRAGEVNEALKLADDACEALGSTLVEVNLN